MFFHGLYSEPIKSMIGADGTGIIASDDKPYDSEVEYIESTGTQYIDTGIFSSNDLDVELAFEIVPFSGEQRIFGQSSVSYVYRWGYTSTGVFVSNGGDYSYSDSVVSGNKYVIRLIGNDFYCNGEFVRSMYPRKIGEDKLYIFAWKRFPMLYGKMRLNYCIIRSLSTEEVLRYFVPVRKNGVGYVYDFVSEELYVNQGTGNFIIGPDKE